ncbi:MAG: cell division protein FtsZ, partial [Solirubrobacterales bacterium]|nr:cell division protein FtsZ [Solirubrobacterales bacterium]
MASNKRDRASMREGPLAALFRKTDEDDAAAKAPEPKPPADAAGHEDEPRIPSPQERLRHAFSADIPENLMERTPEPATPAAAAAPAPPSD